MRRTMMGLGLALAVSTVAASGCAVSDDSEADGSQSAELSAKPDVSAFVLTVQGIESEEVFGPGTDNFCDGVCSYAFLGGTALRIRAIGSSADCFAFSMWDAASACAGQPANCNIVINSDLTITARFARIPGCKVQ